MRILEKEQICKRNDKIGKKTSQRVKPTESEEPSKMKRELVQPGKQELSWKHFRERYQHLILRFYFSPMLVSSNIS